MMAEETIVRLLYIVLPKRETVNSRW